MEVQETQQQPHPTSIIEWAVARQQNTKGKEKTELSVVKATPSGILVGIVDGFGHGEEAKALAETAAAILEDYTHQTLSDLFNRCDKACRGTNGVAISAAIFNTGLNMVTWFGVGNVQATLFHRSPAADPRHHSLERFTGLVGSAQFRLREICLPVKPGDLLILATEGLKPEFYEALPIDGKPRLVADQLLAKYAREDADSLIIVARYLGH